MTIPRCFRHAVAAILRAMHEPAGTERRIGSRQGNKVDNRSDVAVAALATREWGVLSLDELRACGLSRKQVLVRVRRGALHPVHRGVYAVGHRGLSFEGRLLAAVKACGAGAVLSHYSAAALWQFVRWDGRRIEITVAGSAARAHPGLRVHRAVEPGPAACVHRRVPITTPRRTLLDLAAILDERALRRAVREAQALKRVDLRNLASPEPRRGSRKLARLVATGVAPTRSELEDAVLELILRGGLEHPDVNVPLVLAGRRIIPDFRWPARLLVVEADGAAWHEHRLAREDDAVRQALLEAHGERVLRVTWHQAITEPSQTLARLRAAGAPLKTISTTPASRRWSST